MRRQHWVRIYKRYADDKCSGIVSENKKNALSIVFVPFSEFG